MLLVLVREEAFEIGALLGQFSLKYSDACFFGVHIAAGVDQV